MKRIIFSVLLLLITAGPASALTVGGLDFTDTAFADTLISSNGTFITSGDTLAQVLTDKDPATWGASWTSGAYVQLGFTDNVIVNGQGADLALFELGRPDTFKLSLTLGGTTIEYLSQYSGSVVGGYNLNVALVNLDDFGILTEEKVSQIVVGLDVLSDTGVVPTFSMAGAVNSAAPETADEPPVADAGKDQTVHVGRTAYLDGSGSSDPDGNVPLSYFWQITEKPSGSQAELSDPTLVNPTFVPDINGDYKVQLIVTDNLELSSAPATVTVSTFNSAPVAAVGPNQFITAIGTLVELDGSQSYDEDGDPLTYEWTMTNKPANSNAMLNLEDPQKPTFIADIHGEYQIELVVKDLWSTSQPAMVTVSFLNVKPVADPGVSWSVVVYDSVRLDGSGSYDANEDSLTYKWNFVSVPEGSSPVLDLPGSATPTFVPLQPGTYVVQLIVNDGFVDSDPSTVQIEVITFATKMTRAIQSCLQAQIATMAPEAFKNPNMKNALLNKLNAILKNIDSGNFAGGLDQLKHDLLPKMDGCATSVGPDKDDWIVTFIDQGKIYPCLMDIIAELDAHP